MHHLYLILAIIIFLIIACVYSFRWNGKQLQNTKKLFDETLVDLCINAKSIHECNAALDTLMSNCVERHHFKIHRAYQSKFYELRAILHGKLSILNTADVQMH